MKQAAVAMGLQNYRCDKAAPRLAECQAPQRKEAEYQRQLAAELQKDFGTRGIPLSHFAQPASMGPQLNRQRGRPRRGTRLHGCSILVDLMRRRWPTFFAEEEEAGNTPADSRLSRRGSLALVDSSQADGSLKRRSSLRADPMQVAP